MEARTWIKWLRADARIVVQTEGRPLDRYAARLEVAVPGGWQAIRLFDNAHGRHDEHRYVGASKLPAREFQAGTVHDVLPAAIRLLSSDFERIIEDWRTRSDD